MIIVTGATGQLGQQIVQKLVERVPAKQVGVSVRDVRKAAELEALGVRVRHGDFAVPASLPHAFEGAELANEDAVLKLLERSGRTAPVFVTMDPRGKMLSSEQLAEFLRSHLERGTQELIFAIGPADGWSERAKKAANNLISFGPITLPHELARVVLLEQPYRGFCILQGHPYHDGH